MKSLFFYVSLLCAPCIVIAQNAPDGCADSHADSKLTDKCTYKAFSQELYDACQEGNDPASCCQAIELSASDSEDECLFDLHALKRKGRNEISNLEKSEGKKCTIQSNAKRQCIPQIDSSNRSGCYLLSILRDDQGAPIAMEFEITERVEVNVSCIEIKLPWH